jgi:hypothetical protein
MDSIAPATGAPAAEPAAPASTPEAARVRAGRIRAGIEDIAAWVADVEAAYAGRDWAALGYGSWDGYIDGEYGEHRVRVPRELRREVVASMRGVGMSTRAIGGVLGVSEGSVRNDLKSEGAQKYAPDATAPAPAPAPTRGRDGKRYPSRAAKPAARKAAPRKAAPAAGDGPAPKPAVPPTPVPSPTPDGIDLARAEVTRFAGEERFGGMSPREVATGRIADRGLRLCDTVRAYWDRLGDDDAREAIARDVRALLEVEAARAEVEDDARRAGPAPAAARG